MTAAMRAENSARLSGGKSSKYNIKPQEAPPPKRKKPPPPEPAPLGDNPAEEFQRKTFGLIDGGADLGMMHSLQDTLDRQHKKGRVYLSAELSAEYNKRQLELAFFRAWQEYWCGQLRSPTAFPRGSAAAHCLSLWFYCSFTVHCSGLAMGGGVIYCTHSASLGPFRCPTLTLLLPPSANSKAPR